MYGKPEDLIGTLLSETYRLERVVGEGAYGTVFAATHVRLNRNVAVKVLRAHEEDAFARFRREAEITSSLGSRFIAQVFDFNIMKSGAPYLVMELLDGEDLGTRLSRKRTIALREALRICEQVAMALSVAHRHDIVHRDLKPQNIFLCSTEDEGEVVKVIDFGISKVLSKVGTTAAGQFIGTPLYMSPEQVRGRQDQIDGRSDIYALAIVLYEALGGRPAYNADTVFELVEKINGPELPTPLSESNPDIPVEIDQVLARAMAKSRDDRPASVTDFYNTFRNAISSTQKSEPASTPAAAIVGTHALETMYATGMVATPLWRGRTGADDEVRFVAPDGGFFGNDHRNRSLKLTTGQTEFNIGSVPTIGPITNDLVLPHRQVSRNAVKIIVRDGRAYMRREPKCSVPVRVGLSILERGEERPLHHGQALAIGVVAGIFHDGRFVPSQVPAGAVDEQTSLLGREGLAWEVALAARLAEGRRMVLAVPTGEHKGDEGIACRVALALHDRDSSLPVARFSGYAAALISATDDVAGLAAAAAAAAEAPLLVGHLDVGENSDEAGVRIDEAIGALRRLAASGKGEGLVDLSQHQLTLLGRDQFVAEARKLAANGGEIGLLSLEDRPQLEQLGDGVCAALDLELLQVAGHVAGGQTIFCRPTPGSVAFAGPDAAEPIARQVGAEWHSRGPVRGEVLEVERSVALDVISPGELDHIERLATELGSGSGFGAGVEGLPLPIATPARNAMSAGTPLERAKVMTTIVSDTWRFLAVAFRAMAAATRRTGEMPTQPPPEEWAEPWRTTAVLAARSLAATPGRVGELVQALFDTTGPKRPLQNAHDHAAQMYAMLSGPPEMTGTVQQQLNALQTAVGDLLLALRPLRGWTLVSVDRVDRVDVFGDCETVHYIDYTGTYERGTPRQVTIIKDLRMGPFVYLTRFAEGIVVPLEPQIRRRFSPSTGAPELYWADELIDAPGSHTYRSVVSGGTLQDDVTAKQIPRGARRSG